MYFFSETPASVIMRDTLLVRGKNIPKESKEAASGGSQSSGWLGLHQGVEKPGQNHTMILRETLVIS